MADGSAEQDGGQGSRICKVVRGKGEAGQGFGGSGPGGIIPGAKRGRAPRHSRISLVAVAPLPPHAAQALALRVAKASAVALPPSPRLRRTRRAMADGSADKPVASC
jgi:hypothetical protein